MNFNFLQNKHKNKEQKRELGGKVCICLFVNLNNIIPKRILQLIFIIIEVIQNLGIYYNFNDTRQEIIFQTKTTKEIYSCIHVFHTSGSLFYKKRYIFDIRYL